MITNSDRVRIQVYLEERFGCYDVANIRNYKDQFAEFTIDESNLSFLKRINIEDGRDLFSKGMLSFCQGLHDLNHGLESWAVIKFYYSNFYFLKASLAFKGFSILRIPTFNYLKIEEGKKLVKINPTNGKYGDHPLTIKMWKRLVGADNDKLLEGRLDEEFSYDWMMRARETIQYRKRKFDEPNGSFFFKPQKLTELSKLVNLYENDNEFVFCFDAEHACLAISVKRALLSLVDFERHGLQLKRSDRVVIRTLVSDYFETNSRFTQLLN